MRGPGMDQPHERRGAGLRLLVALFLIGSAGLNFYAHRLQDSLRRDQEGSRSSLQGQPAPEFSVVVLETSAAGETAPPRNVNLADHRGKLVFLSFWASWCRPCDYELPLLDQFYRAHRQRGVEVLAISTDDTREAALAYAQSRRFALPMLWDQGGHVAELYQVNSLPTLVVIDPEGRVRQHETGLRYDLDSWLREQVSQLLGRRERSVEGAS